ncbi:signal peptidase complex-like protein DTM1 [Sesamum indicum]|uniref:Signal peptidase complex-like protein DTM1 n=1 Tax=Sesamum indicum TaxID=4182 RepID=A0A6I9SUK5_SESIN|nr:signal peptidase complex-like protein DTM1 [Sesamum indicum]
MENDAVLRTSLVWLAAIMVLTWLYTQSLKKMAVTYLFGMLAIGGVVLPDWKFFDRPVSQWCTLVTDDDADSSQSAPATARFKFYPVRLLIYATVYGFAFHKWWKFITS